MYITLLVDIGAEHLAPETDARLPVLERCLARCDPFEPASHRFQDCLLDDFGVQRDDAPIAALSLAGEGEAPGSAYWLRADPVTLQPTLHRLAGRALKSDEIDWNEAQAHAAVIAPHLRSDHCELTVKHPARWYLRCPPQRLRTQPLPTTLIPLDESLMPTGPDASRWQRTMTEAQMLLHAADLEGERDLSGRVPINGIWCWGGGKIDTPPRRSYTDVFSDAVLALGLGRLSGASAAALPDDARTMISGSREASGRRVLIALSAEQPIALTALESNWLAPLVSLVDEAGAAQLELRLLLSTRAIGRRVTRKSLRRWWRRSRPLAAHA